MRIWQDAVKKSPQLAAGLEPELQPAESLTNMARRTGPLKENKGRARPLEENKGRARPLKCKQTVFS